MNDQTTNPDGALVPADSKTAKIVETYPLLRPGAIGGLLDVLRENVGDAGIEALDLPRIKVPSGGSTLWAIQDPEGESSSKTIEGIILGWHDGRLYWKYSLNEGGGKVPPDCVSRDGFVGIGNPGGECRQCPHSKFGSSQKGKGQACKAIRQLLIAQEDKLLPSLLTVPPTSLKPAQQYFMALLSRGLPYWTVVTKISLERATNDAGIAYAKMTFSAGRVLSHEQRATLTPFHRQMNQMLAPGALDVRDYVVEGEEPAGTGNTDPDVPF